MASELHQPDRDTLEQLFRLLSEALEAVEADRQRLYLAKLSLVLAGHIGDAELVRQATELARRDL
jgi:hypothetical protein